MKTCADKTSVITQLESEKADAVKKLDDTVVVMNNKLASKDQELVALQVKLDSSVSSSAASSDELRSQLDDLALRLTTSETSNAQLRTQLASNQTSIARSQEDAATFARLETDVVRISNERDGSLYGYRQGFVSLSSQANVHLQAAISSLQTAATYSRADLAVQLVNDPGLVDLVRTLTNSDGATPDSPNPDNSNIDGSSS